MIKGDIVKNLNFKKAIDFFSFYRLNFVLITLGKKHKKIEKSLKFSFLYSFSRLSFFFFI